MLNNACDRIWIEDWHPVVTKYSPIPAHCESLANLMSGILIANADNDNFAAVSFGKSQCFLYSDFIEGIGKKVHAFGNECGAICGDLYSLL